MKNLTRVLCLILAVVMTMCLVGCGKEKGGHNDDTEKASSYIGTWKGSDHDEENVVHYLIFDNDGYWNIYMNYKPLVKAIKQLPEQLVSFKIFRRLQNSAQTGCFFEYVNNDDDSQYADTYVLDDQGRLTVKGIEDIHFVKISEDAGEPDETIIEESRDLFDRAREEALLKQ